MTSIPLWRHICSFVVIVAMCYFAYIEQAAGLPAPTWFIGIGSAVISQYLIEFFQNANERRERNRDLGA